MSQNAFRLASTFAILVVGMSGCRNQQCGGYQPWRPFSQSTIISPPGTNTLNIPGANQSYYPANNTAANPYPAQTPPVQQNNNGWQGTNPNPGVGYQQIPSYPTGYQQSPTGQFTATQFQVASSTANPLGSSRVISPDFTTTRVDERTDKSRMPVSDASQARAPGNFIPGQVVFNGTFQQPRPQAYQPSNVVLAQASTNPTNNPNFQNGWRATGPNQNPINR